MSTQLPKGWIEVKLDNIATIGSGGTPSRANSSYWGGNIPWIKISDIQGLYVDRATEFITQDGLNNSSAKIFPKGTILLTIFATIGRVGILQIDATTNQAIAGITPSTELSSKYIAYSLTYFSHILLEQGKGVAQKNINQSILKSLPLPLAPSAEQKRIADKLDTLFGHMDNVNARLERIPDLLKQFRQQVLTQAVTGKLTEDWRKEHEVSIDAWETRELSDVTLRVTDGDHQAPPKSEAGIPFIVISNISDGVLDLSRSSRFVPDEYYNNLKEYRRPQPDDVLYTVTGSIGIPVHVDTEAPFAFQRHIGLIRPDKKELLSKYLYYILGSEDLYKQALEVATGTAQLTIPLGGIRKFKVNLPPLEEQKEIVRRVDALFAVADAIEKQYNKLQEKAAALPQAILSKAFCGELVPQDPNDEPATELLKRIQTMKKQKS